MTNSAEEPASTVQERVKVVIVGAGASALQCANSLVETFGFEASDLLLLEARDRIGGRIHSERKVRRCVTNNNYNGQNDGNPIEEEFVLDHGAAWVHGTGFEWGVDPIQFRAKALPEPNPMMDLLVAATPPGKSVYDYHLRRVVEGNPWMRPQTVLHDQNEIVFYVAGEKIEDKNSLIEAALNRHFSTMAAIVDYGTDMYDSGRGMETVTCSLEEAIQAVQANDALQEPLSSISEDEASKIKAVTLFYQHLLECWYGAAASDLQLCEFADAGKVEIVAGQAPDAKYSEVGDFLGPHCTLIHGMEKVLEPLLRNGIEERIRLEHPVVRISHISETKKVVVETANTLSVEADCCVVTIPAGCLKEAAESKVFFGSELSNEKLEAISYLHMGTYKKVFLTFDRIFWPEKPVFIALVRKADHSELENTFGNHLLLNNMWASRGIPCIEAVLFGKSGIWAAHKSVSEIRDAVLEFMKDSMALIEEIHSYCQDCEVTRWEEDPFSRGAYSAMQPGALLRHVEELRRPEWNGQLLLSGEATITEHEGSVHAALFSGRNAAEKVHELMSLKLSQ